MGSARGASDVPTRAPEVVVVGSAMVDLISYVGRVPHAGETMYASNFEQGFGGKGANQAAAVALHGVGVAWVGCVGDDLFGPATVSNLDQRGIDVAHARTITGTATGTALILVEPSGQNRIVLGAGANVALDEAQVHAAFDGFSNEVLRAPAVVVSQLETPQPAAAAAFERARALGAVTVLNPGPAAPLDPRLVAACDWLVPNESELAILLGLAGDHPVDDALARAPGLAAELDVGLVVTLGAGGAAIVAGGGGAAHVPAPRVEAFDTTGAGDAFVGAFATAVARGAEPRRAVELAVAFASDSVTRPGTQASYRPLAQLADLGTPGSSG
jgi:ribokinase